MRQTINKGKANYFPNSLGGGCPYLSGQMDGGFTSYPERVEGHKIRQRSPSFIDFFSQAKLFFNSQSEPEKNHIIDALSFELGKVQTVAIRERILLILSKVDDGLASEVAYALRLHIPKDSTEYLNQDLPADADPLAYQSQVLEGTLAKSKALSMAGYTLDNIKTRQVAILAADGVDANSLNTVKNKLAAEGAVVEIIAPRQGYVIAENDEQIPVNHSFLTAASVFYDAVYVPGGTNSIATLEAEPDALHFLNEAFKHCKAIAADKAALQVIQSTYFGRKLPADYQPDSIKMEGIIISDDLSYLSEQFITAIKQHRFWEREKPRKVPA
jgi:catalase